MKKAILATLVGASLTLLMPSLSDAQSTGDFYKGKNLTLIIESGVGEGWDVYGRVFGQYVVKHIPGNPTLVPQNMPGAGGLTATNYLYIKAPQDGTVIAIGPQASYLEPLFGNSAARFDAKKFLYIGSIDQDVNVCVTWHTSQTKSIEDAMKRETLIANTNPDSNGYIFMKMLNAFLGTKFKNVSGYPGSQQISAAMERGETEGYCGNTFSTLRSTHQDWLDDKLVNIIMQLGLQKSRNLPDVPLVMDYLKDEAARQAFSVVLGSLKMSRTVVGPPNIPDERAKILRQAFEETMKDPEYIAAAEKARLGVNPISGAEAEGIIAGLYALPASAVQSVIAIRSSRD